MNSVHKRITELRHKINGQPYVTPGENTLADDLMTLCDIVGDLDMQPAARRVSDHDLAELLWKAARFNKRRSIEEFERVLREHRP